MNITINDDLSSLVVSEDGLMECILPPYNPETQVPFTSEAEVNAFASTINTNPNYLVNPGNAILNDNISNNMKLSKFQVINLNYLKLLLLLGAFDLE